MVARCRFTTLGALAVLTLLLVSLDARADCSGSSCGLAGSVRFQVGNVPLPFTLAPAPNGVIRATPAAEVTQGAIAPRSLVFDGMELTNPVGPSLVVPVYNLNPNLYQISTSLGASFPSGMATFSEGGRIGASTVTWCPGSPPPPPMGNPGCAGSALGALRYTKTANQFGGAATPNIFGSANAALGPNPAPCVGCTIIVPPLTPIGSRAIGGGFIDVMGAAGINNPGVFTGTVGPQGTVALGADLGVAATGDVVTSYGGPWTTGMVTVTAPGANPSMFILTGTDQRSPGGSGLVSMVAGGMAERSLSGPTAHIGQLTLLVPEAGSSIGLGASMAGLVGIHALMRRLRRRGRLGS